MQFRLNVCATVFQSYCRHLEREVSFGGGYRVSRRLDKALVCAGEARAQQAQHRAAAAAQ
uniref:CYCP3 n=1 Tax=Arundo donax TaxID=35708 RepID=A0A0A9HH63_ARUDO